MQGINLDFGSDIKDDCNNGMLEIFNGCDKDHFLVEKICLRHSDVQKGILWVSSGSCVTVNFSSGQGMDNKFHLSVAESVGKNIFILYSTVCRLFYAFLTMDYMNDCITLYIGHFVP